MSRAISLAQAHRPHPNPRVGAVIVSAAGEILGEGAHHAAGGDHAEIAALKTAPGSVAGSTMYVSLEPCSHHGRTPPCVEAIIEAGIDRVVIAAADPDERVSGSGVTRLREAGIEVVEGLLSEESRSIDPGYFHHRATGMPLVTVKYAMTLDGSAAAADGSSQWITSEEARRDAHELRAGADGVVVGAGTLRVDDPLLDVRLPEFTGTQPRPIIVAGVSPLPTDARIWERAPVVVVTEAAEVPSGEVLVVDGSPGRPDPTAVCRALGDQGMLSLLVEGGPTLSGAWLRSGVATRGVAYLGAKLGLGHGIGPVGGVFNSIDGARVVNVTSTRSLGLDIRVDFEI